jgi:autotransporter-associated beta strand protein
MITKYLIKFPAVVAAAFLFAPSSGSAQSILLTASDFTLLGGTAITSTGVVGTTIRNGNVGLSPGATTGITGFPPAVIINGGIIATGGVTSQARLDLITASVGLANMPSNSNMSNVNLGGTTLTPGVYTFNGAAALNGALTLDAQGQNNVAWVFQIGTALTTSINSSVTFINLGSNGGSDLGLFWNAGSAVTLGANNQAFGNYLAGTSITFGALDSIGGRGLALAGISLDNTVVNARGGPGGGDLTGGLTYNLSGAVVAAPSIVTSGTIIVPGGSVTSSGTVIPNGGGNTGTVLLSSTGAYATGSSGVVLVPGTAFATAVMTIDGVASNGSAASSLTVTNATATLSAADTYTGGTVLNGGTLIASSANLPANQSVALSNAGALIVNQTVDGSFGGVVSGAGSLTKLGAGVLTVSGSNTYTGGTFVSAGTMSTNAASLPANRAVVLASGATLSFNQTADGTFGGNITGGGTIQKKGSAALTLSNATNSPIDLQAGSLNFNGGVGATTVASGAVLGGNGTISGNLVNNGRVSPGSSPGTLNVTGNYTQSSTGTLLIEIASLTSVDRLAMTGTAALAGTLQVDTLGGYNPVGQSFAVLSAPGGVSGTFGTFTANTNHAAVGASVSYSATAVTVAFAQLPFTGFATTSNQRAIGTAAQSSATLTTALDAVALASEMPAALNAVSPQGYEIWSEIAFAHSTALADRLAHYDGAYVGHDHYYFDVDQRRGRARADRDVGQSTFTSTAALVGGDHAVDANQTFGAFVNHGETTADLASPGSRTNVKDTMIGVRSAWTQGPMFVHAAYGYGFDKYTSTRRVNFSGTSAAAKSSTRGRQWLAGVSAGQHFNFDAVTVSPFVGVLASGWRAQGFTETGAGAFNATLANQSARSLRSQVGFESRLGWKVASVGLQPHVRAAWLHEFSNRARQMDASFGAVNYAVTTRHPQSDSALLSAGLDLNLSPRAVIYADYTTQTSGMTRVIGEWQAGVSMRF